MQSYTKEQYTHLCNAKNHLYFVKKMQKRCVLNEKRYKIANFAKLKKKYCK